MTPYGYRGYRGDGTGGAALPVQIASQCPPCADAAHPTEHATCAGGECGCHCRRALRVPERRAEPDRHQPLRMLDLSEVTVGCWVSWRGSEEAEDGDRARGGVVTGIDRVPDRDTGEMMLVFYVAKVWQHGVRFGVIRQEDVGAIDLPNDSTIRRLWRAMAREIADAGGSVMPREREMGDLIHRLQRSGTA